MPRKAASRQASGRACSPVVKVPVNPHKRDAYERAERRRQSRDVRVYTRRDERFARRLERGFSMLSEYQ